MITFLQETPGDGAKRMIVKSIKFEAFFLQTNICPTLQKLNGQISNIVLNFFFSERGKRVINLYTKFLNCGHLFDPFVLDKMWLLFKEEFEDTKGVIRIRISKKNRQHNGQKKKDKERSIKHTHKRANKIYVLLLLHIFISFNPRTTHQTSQSQAMQIWTHLRP